MQMEHRLIQTQSQRLMLTQKMQQALQVLQLSGVELDQYVQQELETNPLLDRLERKSDTPEPATTNDAKGSEGGEAFDDVAFDLDAYASRWEQRQKEGRDFSVNTDLAERREHYANSITKSESLSSHLMTQLRFAFPEGDPRFRIGERILGDIDDRGYFTGSIEELAQELEVPLEDVERVLYRIQRFEPTGVGARDVAECLLLQINVECPDNTELKTLVEHHLDDLQRRQIPKIAKAMNITPERVEELRHELSTLNPWPGREFESEPTQYVTPDLVVEKLEDDWVVRLTNDSVPHLKINSEYKELSQQKDAPKDQKKYLREKMESARWLIRNIEQRQQTILKIGTAIMEVQKDFLDKGVSVIRPLTLQEIADRVGVHEATVSRTTRGKYIQTPQGLFELKYFFSPGLKHSEGAQNNGSADANGTKAARGYARRLGGRAYQRAEG